MKKNYLILFLLSMCALLLVACNKEKEENVLEEFVNQFEINDTLNSTYTYKGEQIELIIESSDENVITNQGDIFYTLDYKFVDVKITFRTETKSIIKHYEYLSEPNEEKVYEDVYNHLNIPTETKSDLNIPITYKYGKYTFVITFTSKNPDIISNEGIITLSKNDQTANINVNIRYREYETNKDFEIKVLKITRTDFENEIKTLIETEVETNITLPTTFTLFGKTIELTWQSENESIIDNKGNVIPKQESINVNLTATSSLGYSYTFNITVKPLSDQTALELAQDEVTLPTKLSSSIILPTTLTYGVTCTWKSSNPSIIDNNGNYVSKQTNYKTVTLTATLKKGQATMEKEFKIACAHEEHMFIDRTFEATKSNVHIEGNKLVLDDNQVTGYYETGIIETNKFSQAVGSYTATSSKNATCELMVSIRVNGSWSRYLSYGAWGLGLENKATNQSDSIGKIAIDIVQPISGEADAFKLKLVLKRNNVNVESPKVTLIALTLKFTNYTFNVDISNIPNEVHYQINNLYQQIVPTIGNSICSATSSTMLLNYKGHSFEGLADYEHEYMAWIVRDYKNNIFGNWTYNTIAMGAFGETSYVKKFCSLNELLFHLATVGPLAASVGGYVINNVKNYNTGGHLLVISGYKIENGQISLYINDPNVNSNNVIMTAENFMNVYGGTNYVVE